MTSDTNDDGFFKAAYKNSEDVTDIYLNRTTMVSRLLGDARCVASEFDAIVRAQMEKSNNGTLGRFSDVPASVTAEILEWQRAGLIGAVDGTAAIAQTILPDKVVFGVAIATVTTKKQGAPKVTFTRTHRDEKPPHEIQSLLELQEALEDAAGDASWTRTYREFLEREAAIKLANDDGCRLVLLDGPIYTQNLLTQEMGRARVLDEIRKNQHRYIGYIKEPSPFHKRLGSALMPGEWWIFDIYKGLLEQKRFSKDKQSENDHPATAWIKKASHWVRCIYKLKQKAFEFECDPSMVMHGLALLKVDPSYSLNHEIPFLLELVDKHVRAKTDAVHISKDLIASLGQHAISFENEREYRI